MKGHSSTVRSALSCRWAESRWRMDSNSTPSRAGPRCRQRPRRCARRCPWSRRMRSTSSVYWRSWGPALLPGIGSPTSGSTEMTTRVRSRAWISASLVMFSSCLAAESEKAIRARRPYRKDHQATAGRWPVGRARWASRSSSHGVQLSTEGSPLAAMSSRTAANWPAFSRALAAYARTAWRPRAPTAAGPGRRGPAVRPSRAPRARNWRLPQRYRPHRTPGDHSGRTGPDPGPRTQRPGRVLSTGKHRTQGPRSQAGWPAQTGTPGRTWPSMIWRRAVVAQSVRVLSPNIERVPSKSDEDGFARWRSVSACRLAF